MPAAPSPHFAKPALVRVEKVAVPSVVTSPQPQLARAALRWRMSPAITRRRASSSGVPSRGRQPARGWRSRRRCPRRAWRSRSNASSGSPAISLTRSGTGPRPSGAQVSELVQAPTTRRQPGTGRHLGVERPPVAWQARCRYVAPRHCAAEPPARWCRSGNGPARIKMPAISSTSGRAGSPCLGGQWRRARVRGVSASRTRDAATYRRRA